MYPSEFKSREPYLGYIVNCCDIYRYIPYTFN